MKRRLPSTNGIDVVVEFDKAEKYQKLSVSTDGFGGFNTTHVIGSKEIRAFARKMRTFLDDVEKELK